MATREKPTTHPTLAEALRACRRSLLAVVLFSLLLNVLALATPLYVLQLYDRVLPNRTTDTLVVLSIAVMLALAAHAGLYTVRRLVMQRLGDWLERKVGGEVLAVSIRRAVRKRHTPSVSALRDLASVRSFVAGSSLLALLDVPWTIVFILVIFVLHPSLGLITLIGAGLLVALTVLSDLLTRDMLRRAGDAQSEAQDQAQAALRNADAIEAMGMRRNLLRLFERKNDVGLQLLAIASARSDLLAGLSRLVREGMQVVLLGMATWLAVGGQLSGGMLFAAMFLMRRVASPLDRAVGSWKSVVSARSAYARVLARLASEPPDIDPMQLPAPASGRLEVEGLTYEYEGRSEPVIKNVRFELAPGEVLGLVGPTAAGKSTLARMLVGIIIPDAGHVRLDGVEVSQWHPEIIGPHLGYLPQGVELFAGTVAENIARLGKPEPTKVIEAATLAGAHEMILRLPRGYDTEIGEGGAMLSGGQRQRIGLARAVYGNPKLVVLDEPDANLDREGKEALASAVHAMKRRGTTVVLVTHRSGMLKVADKILMLKRAALVPVERETEPQASVDSRPAGARLAFVRSDGDD